jgi:hypothetical protein
MARSKVDAKEFMLLYGDRVGLGIAGLFTLLFLVFAVLGGGGGTSADQIKQSSQTASTAIQNSQVDPDDIKLVNEPVLSLARIDSLSKALTRSMPIDVLSLAFRFFAAEELRGDFSSNPEAFRIVEIAAFPIVSSFKIYETRIDERNKKIDFMVLTATDPSKTPVRAGGRNPGRPAGGAGGPLGGAPPPPSIGAPGGGGLGIGSGGMGLGAGGAGGLQKGSGGGQRGRPGGAAPGKTPPPGPEGGGVEDRAFQASWKSEDQVRAEDTLGVTIRPLRNTMIVASYPHARQVDDIARKLHIDKNAVANYYKGLDVQRRVILPRGKLLPDGTYATVDMVLALDPKDTNKTMWRPIADAEASAANVSEYSEDAARRDGLAGWVKVDMRRIVGVMASAYSVAQSSNDAFYSESDPVLEQLVGYAGARVAMRLPRLVRGEYPKLYDRLPELQKVVQKIKDVDASKIPPPPKDPRITRGGGDDPFGYLAGEPGRDPAPANPGARPPSGEPVGNIPELIPLRFLDVDLDPEVVGGQTYEYRIRMILSNPNFGQEKAVAAPDFAKIESIYGEWSPVARVSFLEDSQIYADERSTRKPGATTDLDRDKIQVQLHKWIGRTETIERTPLTVGDWWVERLLVSRGEYVGKSPDLPGEAGTVNLVQWVAYAYDSVNQMIGADVQRRVRTPALLTQTVLVDFTGGMFQTFMGPTRIQRRDDVPAEILLLEPDGRVTAHLMPQDRENESRRNRFTRWEEWVRNVGKPRERAPAGAGGGAAGLPGGTNPK